MKLPINIFIKGIIQAGANDGAELNRFALFTNNIICFEPVKAARDNLNKSAALIGEKSVSVYNFALSDQTGTVDFFIGQETGNSSLFDLNPARPHFHQKNQHKERVRIPSITLDDFFRTHNHNPQDFNYLYMDVQGAEHLVLLGGKETLKHIDCIWMEVSYFEIYNSTMLFEDITKLCHSLGFKLQHHKPSIHNQNQGDALYVRDSLVV